MNKQLYKQTLKAFNRAYAQQQSMHPSWRLAEDYLYGNHWKGSRMPKYKSKITSNFFFEAIETTVPIVCARDPEPDLSPRSEVAAEYAPLLKRLLKRIWVKERMKRKSREAFRSKETYGNGIIKSVKVPNKQRIISEVVDVFQLLPEPGCSTIDECYYRSLIHAVVMPVSEIYSRYGKVVQSEGDLDEFKSFQWVDQLKGGADSMIPVESHDYARVSSDPADGWEKTGSESRVDTLDETAVPDELVGQALVIERWWYDHKAKKSMVTTVVRGNTDGEGIVLLHTENPYPRLPFFMEKNYSEPHSFHGRSEVHQITSLIRAENMILSQVVDHYRLSANPRAEVLRGAGIDTSQITNKPGGYHFSSIPNGFRWIDPPKMNDALPMLGYLRQAKDYILGIHDSYRGISSSSSESGTHAQALMQQTASRLQPKIDEHVEMLQELFEHWLWIITNMFAHPEIVRQREEGGEVSFKELVGIDSEYEDYDLSIVVGSTLPYDNYAAFDEAGQLYDRQLLPPEMLIEAAPRLKDKERAKKYIKEVMQRGQQGNLTPEEQQVLQGDDEDAILQVLMAHPEMTQQGVNNGPNG